MTMVNLRIRTKANYEQNTNHRDNEPVLVVYTKLLEVGTEKTYEVALAGTRSKMAPDDVLSLSYIWSSHQREKQNTLRVVFSNAAQSEVGAPVPVRPLS